MMSTLKQLKDGRQPAHVLSMMADESWKIFTTLSRSDSVVLNSIQASENRLRARPFRSSKEPSENHVILQGDLHMTAIA